MKKLIIFVIAATLSACAYKHQPIYNVADPMPVAVEQTPIDRIESIIVQAGQTLDWKFQRVEPGHLLAVQSQPKYSATVDILFDQKSYKIVYNTSTGLNAENGTVHSHYNFWIRNLEKAINVRLTNSAFN